jgi:Na+/phosphate symporter
MSLTGISKEQQREKLDQLKDEQNRKFSLLYEHYKANLDAVYQQTNLRLTESQQHELDQMSEDLERQMSVLYQSHAHRKQQQAETFQKESEYLDMEREQKFKVCFGLGKKNRILIPVQPN